MEKNTIAQIGILSLTCIIAGGFAGANLAGGFSEGSAEQTLSAYPLDLSLSGLHRHDRRNVPEENAPEVDLTVNRDSMMPGHFNLEIDTENFEFAPQNVSSDFFMGQGHAHVFVDDTKISRSYGNWYHLPRLKSGNHTIRVTLNTNNHQEYAIDGVTISDSETVSVSENAEMNMEMDTDMNSSQQ